MKNPSGGSRLVPRGRRDGWTCTKRLVVSVCFGKASKRNQLRDNFLTSCCRPWCCVDCVLLNKPTQTSVTKAGYMQVAKSASILHNIFLDMISINENP